MIAQLLMKSGATICSNCRIRQQELKETCSFCGALFSNYEEFLIENWDTLRKEEVYGEALE